MNRIFFLTIVLATTGSSVALGMQRDYYDPVISAPDKKPTDYNSHQDNMDRLIKQNEKLIKAQNLDDLVDFVGEKTSGDSDNCWATTSVRKPFVIQTNSSTDFVVQSHFHNFEQKIKWTECINKKQSCFGSVFVHNSNTRKNDTPGKKNIEAQCGEKYGAVSLYIYDPEKNELRYKMYEVPVACACKFRSYNN